MRQQGFAKIGTVTPRFHFASGVFNLLPLTTQNAFQCKVFHTGQLLKLSSLIRHAIHLKQAQEDTGYQTHCMNLDEAKVNTYNI